MSFELDRLANQLDWNLLRTFMVIVQERSITAAAQRLNVTQPSVSAALRRLEERLEVQLVERGSGRSFQVTGPGERVYREALEIYGGVVRLNALGSDRDEVLSGNIVIYRSSHLDTSFLTPLLGRFRERHPAVTYSLASASCDDVVRALQLRVASLGFCTRLDAASTLTRYQLPAQAFGFYCGANHPLHGCESPGEALLASAPIVGFEGEALAGALAQIVRYRVRHQVGDQMVATTSSVVELVNLLRDMPVIGCLAEQHAARHAPDLWRIPLAHPGPFVDAYAIADLERRNTPAERALLAFLDDAGALGET